MTKEPTQRSSGPHGGASASPTSASQPAVPGSEAEETAVDGEAVDAAAQVDADLDDLTSVQKERDEYLELAQRTRADFENYQKRVARDAERARSRGKLELAAELIPVIDNLDRALAAVSDDDPLAAGVKLVRAELATILERAGVEAYDPSGERFDPTWHEALQSRPADGTKPGVILETVDRGYRAGDQLVRPARVVVSS